MQAPPPVADETGRLAALQRYKVLDTPPEEGLDDLTRLAAYVCQTPMALLTLVDDERQWCKSRVGLAPGEIARRLSFCAHAIHALDICVVEDTHQDARFGPGSADDLEQMIDAGKGSHLRPSAQHRAIQ